jgi:aminoglycoside phosphotransferase (APT) family kinase protein
MTGCDDPGTAEGLTRWLGERRHEGDPVTVSRLHRPTAGYSSETLVAELVPEPSGARDGSGGEPQRLVLRLAPAEHSTFADYDLVPQFEAQQAAASAGVAVADPVLERDPSWLGAPFLAMTYVEGHIIGPVAHLDPWLLALDEASRCRLYTNFVQTLARIHAADPSAAPAVPRRNDAAELDYWDRYLEWSSAGTPVRVLADALTWCRAHRPEEANDPVLLWGDARFENVVFGDDLVPRAVLDWDMATVGSPEHDLAWFTGLDFTTTRLFGTRLSGFPDRDETVALFEEATGNRVLDLEWYETLALLRSAAVLTRIGYLRRDAGEPLMLPIDDNPVLDVLASRLT